MFNFKSTIFVAIRIATPKKNNMARTSSFAIHQFALQKYSYIFHLNVTSKPFNWLKKLIYGGKVLAILSVVWQPRCTAPRCSKKLHSKKLHKSQCQVLPSIVNLCTDKQNAEIEKVYNFSSLKKQNKKHMGNTDLLMC